MIKAVFFDIDGTLFSHKTNTIPETARQAVKQLRKNGILTFVASGRHILEMQEMPMGDLDELGFEGYITLNGQYCYNKQEIIYQNPIEKEDIVSLTEYLNTHPYPCGFFEERHKYINYVSPAVEKIYERMASKILEPGDLKRGYAHPVYQVTVYDMNRGEEEEFQSIMPHCKLSRWNDLAVDILSNAGSKEKGVEAVLNYYGIRREEAMAFGDAWNDIEMLDYVGIGIAMGNAKPEVLRCTDKVTASVDEDGIYRALLEYGLIL
ncbi:MAG: Cof-type HAD-IIB family hydrolase [Lachnospiraceae bacterium]|nr:Cof-type HAD-IIB family hydrolase [Lachnospiraceae bacterium]